MVKFSIVNRDGSQQELEAPDDMGLNLMETLRAFEYEILATCGGMALCGTCHVKLLDGGENLPEQSDAELDMLDMIPDSESNSRLSCQLMVNDSLEGCTFEICGSLTED